MQVMAQEIGTGLLTPEMEDRARNVIVRQAMQVKNPSAAIDVGNRLDVEYEYVRSEAHRINPQTPRSRGTDRRGRK